MRPTVGHGLLGPNQAVPPLRGVDVSSGRRATRRSFESTAKPIKKQIDLTHQLRPFKYQSKDVVWDGGPDLTGDESTNDVGLGVAGVRPRQQQLSSRRKRSKRSISATRRPKRTGPPPKGARVSSRRPTDATRGRLVAYWWREGQFELLRFLTQHPEFSILLLTWFCSAGAKACTYPLDIQSTFSAKFLKWDAHI